jgi:hypothetical protein
MSTTAPIVSKYSPALGLELALVKWVVGLPTTPVARASGRSPISAISSVAMPRAPSASSAALLPLTAAPYASAAATNAIGISA